MSYSGVSTGEMFRMAMQKLRLHAQTVLEARDGAVPFRSRVPLIVSWERTHVRHVPAGLSPERGALVAKGRSGSSGGFGSAADDRQGGRIIVAEGIIVAHGSGSARNKPSFGLAFDEH